MGLVRRWAPRGITGVHSGTTRLPGEEPATVDSSVQAVVDGYGPADLPGLVDLSAEQAPGEDDSPEASLLGGAIRDRLDAARSASPALQVAHGAPPFLVMHGLGDNLVPFTQSVALYDALVAHGNEAILYLIEGFGHGFFNPGHVLELGPDQTLDQGHLERDPQAPASTRAVTDFGRALTERYPSASFAAVEAFFSHTLKPGTPTP